MPAVSPHLAAGSRVTSVAARFRNWRVKGPDGQWHRVDGYSFTYYPTLNRNQTYCGLVIDNPGCDEFMDRNIDWSWPQVDRRPEPVPICETCVKAQAKVPASCPTCHRAW